jgi:hypothetical protein
MKYTHFLFMIFFFATSIAFAQDFNDDLQKREKQGRSDQPGSRDNIEFLKQELGPEWETVALAKIQAEEPETFAELQRLKTKNPAKYNTDLSKCWNRLQRLERLKTDDPKRYESEKRQQQLDRKSKQLARDYRKASNDAQKAQIKNDLKTCLLELFTLREAQRADKVKELEKEIADLKMMLEFREKNKETIIKNRLDQLLVEDERMEW